MKGATVSARLHSDRTRCLDSTAMEANRLQDFIRAGAAAPLHIRTPFCTAPSDWFCRVHRVWRTQRPFHACDKEAGGVGHATSRSGPIRYQCHKSGIVSRAATRGFMGLPR